MPVAVWLLLIILVILVAGALILEPSRKKAEAEPNALFEQRARERDEEHNLRDIDPEARTDLLGLQP